MSKSQLPFLAMESNNPLTVYFDKCAWVSRMGVAPEALDNCNSARVSASMTWHVRLL